MSPETKNVDGQMDVGPINLTGGLVTRNPVFPEPHFSGGQLTPAFENRGSMQIFEGQLGLTPSS